MNMFVLGACYLRHKPEKGPEFLQYLSNILDDNKNYKWNAIAEYDCDFQYYRQNNPNFSWASVNTTFHNNLNKVFNQRVSATATAWDGKGRHHHGGGGGQSTGDHRQNQQGDSHRSRNQSSEVCGRYNMGTCCRPCKYVHV